MGDIEKLVVALLTLTFVAVLVAKGQAAAFIGVVGQFLVNMVHKINGQALT